MTHYLTAHDVVWINTTVTGRTVPYDYQRLEQAVAAQYSYGRSEDVQTQAANMLATFLAHTPFASGNLRTAFVALATFFSANGLRLKGEDAEAAGILRRVAAGETGAGEAVAALAEPTEARLRPGVTLRQLVAHLCNEHADALARLAEGDE